MKINNKIDNVIVEIKKLWKLLKIDSFSGKGECVVETGFSDWFKFLCVLSVEILLDFTISDSVNNNKITLK